jgi:uncharacterized protein (DUF1697 family)
VAVTTCIALLRAVNVAGHNRVAMADLRHLLTELGFDDPRSLLQSGNLVFGSQRRAGPALEAALEAAAREHLGLQTAFLVRTAAEWDAIIRDNPFPAAARDDPGHLLVMCLKQAPTAGAVTALQSAIAGREQVRATGRQAYLVYPDGIGRSRLTAALIERQLGTSGTARNWNTVLRLQALASG